METKLCKDCRWHRPDNSGMGDKTFAKCTHEAAVDPHGGSKLANWLVHGEGPRPDEAQFYYCSTMRDCSQCGGEAKLWEAKETP